MANEKNTIYVGGLADDVNEKLLHDIFIIFGSISEIQASYHFNRRKQTIGNETNSSNANFQKIYRCPLITRVRNIEDSPL
jgi:RNA recognition motif-containing protein